nr:pre-mRNA splicing Prp18-interacting factor [Tanacetum cinerariifolium]
MSTFVLCVGCGEPLYGFSPCRWCTCERCGIDMLNGICSLCHLSNSYANDHNQNSFDCLPDSYHPPHPTYETYSGDTCGNDSHFGYDCPPQFSLNYEPEPGYIENYNSYPYDSPSFPQQYPCCDDCGVTHEPCQCQPKNHDYYHGQSFCYDSNSIGFDQSQTQQYTVTHPIFSAHHDLLGSQKELNMILTKVTKQMTSLTSLCELACQIVQKNLEEKRIEEEQAAKAQSWKFPIDSLFDEFTGELTLLKSFPLGIDKTDCHPEKEIRFAKRLLYDNSFPRPPEEIVSNISNADIESFSPSPIPNEDNGNTGTLNIKMRGDVSDQKVPIPNLTITRILNQEKSPDLLSHLGFEAFHPSAKCPMMINGKNTPVSDVPLFHFYPS